MIQPVSTDVMNMQRLAKSWAHVRVIMFKAALAMLVWGWNSVLWR